MKAFDRAAEIPEPVRGKRLLNKRELLEHGHALGCDLAGVAACLTAMHQDDQYIDETFISPVPRDLYRISLDIADQVFRKLGKSAT